MWLTEPISGDRLDQAYSLSPGQACDLHLSLGSLDPRSQVDQATRFPDELLPDADADLDVVVASTHFTVRLRGARADGGIARARLTLPADGGPARTETGQTELVFSLTAPEAAGTARLRVAYYHRDALVQSQVLDAFVGPRSRPRPGYRIITDFTATASLRDLGEISRRPRTAILVNADPTGNHQVLLRAPGRADGTACTFEVDHEQLREPLDDLRSYLESDQGRPRQRQQTRKQLTAALRRLAPAGARLHDKLFVQARDVLRGLVNPGPEMIIHVTRATTSQMTLPWAFLYEFPLSSVDGSTRVCDIVTNWDEQQDLIQPGMRRCPHEQEPWHRQGPVLCPLGFWGFRYDIEVLTSRDSVASAIPLASGSSMVALSTQRGIDQGRLNTHLVALRNLMQPSGVTHFDEVTTTAVAQKVLRADIPIVYFLCHGTRPGGGDTVLSIGNGDRLPPELFIQWAKSWLTMTPVYWDKVRPLVFINACHSLSIEPTTMLSYVEAFVGGGGASGVIGTEASVHADLAMEAARLFFTTLAGGDGTPGTVAHALRAVRASFLADGNIFGLLYTPYCWADLRLVAG